MKLLKSNVLDCGLIRIEFEILSFSIRNLKESTFFLDFVIWISFYIISPTHEIKFYFMDFVFTLNFTMWISSYIVLPKRILCKEQENNNACKLRPDFITSIFFSFSFFNSGRSGKITKRRRALRYMRKSNRVVAYVWGE